jgi:hypothetical protein
MAEHSAAGRSLDQLLQTAWQAAQSAGPYHPGSLPRFPVPSDRYAGRVEVPLAILARDDSGRRGLYAPARVVLLTFPAGEPAGVADYPGFDPDAWPPPRLGDWPPAALRDRDRRSLEATIARFGQSWLRLLSRWFAGDPSGDVDHLATAARTLLDELDPPGMVDVYRRLNPGFWAWLAARGDDEGARSERPTAQG